MDCERVEMEVSDRKTRSPSPLTQKRTGNFEARVTPAGV